MAKKPGYHGKLLKDMTPAERIVRIAALKAKGADTSKIDASYLSPEDARKRALTLRLKAPIVPGSTTTEQDLKHQIAANTNLKYGPAEADLKQNLLISGAQQTRNAQWYDQYRQQIQAATAQQAQNEQALTNQLGQVANGSQGLAQGINAQQIAGMQADAANRGATVDPNLQQTQTQAAGVRDSVERGYAGQLVGQQANLVGYLNALTAVAGKQKLEQIGKDQGNQAAIRKQQSDLATQKGDFAVSSDQQARSDESKNILQNALAQATLGVKTANAQTASDKAVTDFAAQTGLTPAQFLALSPSERLAAIKKAHEAQTTPKSTGPSTVAKPPSNYTGSPADWNGMTQKQRDAWVKAHTKSTKPAKPPKPTSGLGSLSQGAEDTKVATLGNAVAWAKKFAAQGVDLATARDTLLQGQSGKTSSGGKVNIPRYDQWAVSAALDVAYRGGISRNNVKNLHSMGIHIRGRYPLSKGGKKPTPHIDPSVPIAPASTT